jgi:hypothetical protein
MVPLLGDENFKGQLLRGLRLRIERLDILSADQAGTRGLTDPELLEQAAKLGRVLLTLDHRTMVDHAYHRIAAELPFAGVILVPDWMGFGQALDELELLILVADDAELKQRVQRLPLPG